MQPRLLVNKRRKATEIPGELLEPLQACTQGLQPWPLFISGPAGVGKTCGALCLCDCVPNSLYWTSESFVRAVRAAESGESEIRGDGGTFRLWPSEIFRQWHEATLAVLDELGARGTVTDHHYWSVKQAVDERQGKPTI